MPSRDLVAALTAAGVTDVDDTDLGRALYSSDASLYRVTPLAVAHPRHRDEISAIASVCRDAGVPITARGAGTSIAGNAVGPGLVVDWSRHLDRVLAVDPEARTAAVEPGVVEDALQSALAPHGLRFGPDPSTHSRCTIGGMAGNNACGSRALAWGRTADNVLELDLVTGGAIEARATSTGLVGSAAAQDLETRLRGIVESHLGVIRTEFGRFRRQVSGYSLEHLLPERGFDVARALVGSEGTLALIRELTVRLVPLPTHRLLVVLGYADMAAAADATPAVVAHGPTACEGLDHRITGRLLLRGGIVPPMPRGAGWLLVELSGDNPGELRSRAMGLVTDADALDHLVIDDPETARAIWKIREDGAGLLSRTADDGPAHAGWEDSAVPPERLGDYLREFDALLAQHRLDGVPYGHFGDGCLHVRIDFPLGVGADGGRTAYRSFIDDAADLVTQHGGSLSGEHGDGRARGELLAKMYSPDALTAFAEVKAAFDPDGLLNPGIMVDPDAIDASIRLASAQWPDAPVMLAHNFFDESHRCTGVGRCLSSTPTTVMCPSYRATHSEKDSTRGRARVLQEIMQPESAITWESPEVHEALDLCLSCKGCARDCPTGTDVATMKSEVLYQTYRGRRRPMTHYTLGRLPMWARLAARAPRIVNALVNNRIAAAAMARVVGIDPRRTLPRFADRTFRQSWRSRPAGSAEPVVAPNGTVALWVDSFTNHFSPHVAVAAARVLEAAGYAVQLAPEKTCCALTWITTGQLDEARTIVSRTIDLLEPLAAQGIPIVGLEPSCTAAIRDDAIRLVPGDATERVRAAMVTLAELLARTPDWKAPDLTGVEVVAQPHCHHYSVMGWDTDEFLLRRAGAELTRVGGCCGLAGNWGVEQGHHELSLQIGEQYLGPAVRSHPSATVLADGMSCRTQLDALTGRHGIHLAELLADYLPPGL